MATDARVAFHVAELDCADEALALRSALEQQPGVLELGFDFVRSRMDVVYDPRITDVETLARRVRSAGFHVRLFDEGSGRTATERWRVAGMLLSAVAIVAAVVAHGVVSGDWWAALAGYKANTPHWVWTLYLFAVLVALASLADRIWSAFRHLRPDMYMLVTIAVAGALALGEWLEASVVSCLFALALVLEDESLRRARRAISALLDLAPPTARVQRDSEGWQEVPVSSVQPGEKVAVYAGERIALDGQVVSGRSFVDQSPITGESLPVVKQPGDRVFAGSINGDGTLEIVVTASAENTTIAKILRLVEQAQARRAPVERWVEKFARYYTPAMISLSFLVALVAILRDPGQWSTAIYNGLVLLVIACPCALVISTPVAIVSALTAAARAGVLIKGGQYLEIAGRLRAVAFDKTGTLTAGRAQLEHVVPSAGVTAERLLAIAASLESQSSHPLARAIRAAAAANRIQELSIENCRHIPGLGVEAYIEGVRYWLGGVRAVEHFTGSCNSTLPEETLCTDGAASVVAVGCEHSVLGYLVVTDPIRPEVEGLVEELKRLGVKKTVLITGDHAASAKRVAERAGVDAFYAECMPEDKVRIVHELTQEFVDVAMVGDGINDAPALAASTMGIAMGAIGTDVALETADVALMADNLHAITWLIAHARRTARIVIANITLALATKLVFLGLSIWGAANLWIAIAADMGASLFVILNSLRLARHRPLSARNHQRLTAGMSHCDSCKHTPQSAPRYPSQT